jgi:beta-galactosidase beta subunit
MDVVPKDKVKCLTIISALNDTDLYFPIQDVSIKLKTGEIVIFPPYWTHPYKIRATDSNSVTYILKTWMFGE